jgi:hypothetical protein
MKYYRESVPPLRSQLLLLVSALLLVPVPELGEKMTSAPEEELLLIDA